MQLYKIRCYFILLYLTCYIKILFVKLKSKLIIHYFIAKFNSFLKKIVKIYLAILKQMYFVTFA